MIPEGLRAPLEAALDRAAPGPLGVAVSGGGDSTALLLLLHAAARGRPLAAVTVDHRLRAESAREAAAVAALCAGRGIPHETLHWQGWDGAGNLQDRARQARRALIAGWAREQGIGAVALGHTLDDQAETFLMRLARGSGVDGLAAMAAVTPDDGLVWLRPLLGVRRAALRDWLEAAGVAWAEDPSNADDRFDRVRARAALPALAALGLGPERLAATARAMARAREALEAATAELAAACVEEGAAGDLTLDPGPLRAAPEELRLRLLAAALVWVAGAVYRPRLVRLEAALAMIEQARIGHGLTLHGCVLRARDRAHRDPARARAGGAGGAAGGGALGRALAARGHAAGGRGADDRRARRRRAGAAGRSTRPGCRARPWRPRRRSGARASSSRRRWRGPMRVYDFGASPPSPRRGAGRSCVESGRPGLMLASKTRGPSRPPRGRPRRRRRG